jgi:hypothetical protein
MLSRNDIWTSQKVLSDLCMLIKSYGKRLFDIQSSKKCLGVMAEVEQSVERGRIWGVIQNAVSPKLLKKLERLVKICEDIATQIFQGRYCNIQNIKAALEDVRAFIPKPVSAGLEGSE